jgi:hypothetical protein
MRKFLFVLLIPLQLVAQPFSNQEINRWESQAKQVTIIRDNYGIPHIYGKTDADAVFGLMYAQSEDDFRRVEMNYVEKLGRIAEVRGESELYNDLLIRLIIDSTDAINDLKAAPDWLKKLCNAYADGINYYIYKHPATKPVLLNRFEPRPPFLDGRKLRSYQYCRYLVRRIKNFIQDQTTIVQKQYRRMRLTGSNGFAFSPKITESGNAILFTSIPMLHFSSATKCIWSTRDECVWSRDPSSSCQGFNSIAWMHTRSRRADSYVERLPGKMASGSINMMVAKACYHKKNITAV